MPWKGLVVALERPGKAILGERGVRGHICLWEKLGLSPALYSLWCLVPTDFGRPEIGKRRAALPENRLAAPRLKNRIQ